MYLVDAAWERARVRRVPASEGVDEVVREELAHMLASGVAGLLAGAPLEQTREEVRVELGLPAPEPPPPPSPPPPASPASPGVSPAPSASSFDFDLPPPMDDTPLAPLIGLGPSGASLAWRF